MRPRSREGPARPRAVRRRVAAADPAGGAGARATGNLSTSLGMDCAADEVVAWVYLLRCLADDSLYTGWTVDLTRRLAAHQAGTGSRYTRSRLPVELALALPMPDAGSARREEARIKRLRRPDKLALIDNGRSGVHTDMSDAQSPVNR